MQLEYNICFEDGKVTVPCMHAVCDEVTIFVLALIALLIGTLFAPRSRAHFQLHHEHFIQIYEKN